MLAALAPTAALLSLAWTMPACCCAPVQPPPPSPGPPGTISGQIKFPAGMKPSPLTVYALNGRSEPPIYAEYLDVRIVPPATTYTIAVPPGIYQVEARLDSDPVNAAGYATCHSSTCTAYMAPVRVEAGQDVTRIDISGWHSSYAERAIWWIDLSGVPMSTATGASPPALNPPTPLPVRQRAKGPGPTLPTGHILYSWYDDQNLRIHVDLPADWIQLHSPGESPGGDFYMDYFSNEIVQSPLSLDENGIFMVLEEYRESCPMLNLSSASAQASFFNTPQGMAHFYFLEPPQPAPAQPFEGFEYVGTKEVNGACFFIEFAAPTRVARDSNLALFDQIVFQARYDHLSA